MALRRLARDGDWLAGAQRWAVASEGRRTRTPASPGEPLPVPVQAHPQTPLRVPDLQPISTPSPSPPSPFQSPHLQIPPSIHPHPIIFISHPFLSLATALPPPLRLIQALLAICPNPGLLCAAVGAPERPSHPPHPRLSDDNATAPPTPSSFPPLRPLLATPVPAPASHQPHPSPAAAPAAPPAAPCQPP